MHRFYILAASLLVCLGEARVPFWGKKDTYTPLVFFTVPPGLIPENDAMEKAIREVEHELGVKVERLDIFRNPAAEGAMSLLTGKSPPFLYNRESCQTVDIPPTKGSRDSGEGAAAGAALPTYIDKDRLQAWAKGRYLSPQTTRAKVAAPTVISQESNAIDQDELLEDMSLTPLQRKGKEAIRERTKERGSKKAAK